MVSNHKIRRKRKHWPVNVEKSTNRRECGSLVKSKKENHPKHQYYISNVAQTETSHNTKDQNFPKLNTPSNTQQSAKKHARQKGLKFRIPRQPQNIAAQCKY
ncbi:hypothetical protein WUBG_05584 [Wuchereria bancrofti]|uniref:Uncharacterized protein n=1 Tax=Wuchereria bancrofti TaxID=6293 RepID=J9B8U8_WUCBA|nr:hypothetical protein WUBG_05584 [Wuchereria bancrofti]